MFKRLLSQSTGLSLLLLSFLSNAAAPDATAVMEKAYNAPRVSDQIATLSFEFITPGEQTRHAVYTMVWKDMKGKKGYDSKAIFFTEEPLARKGIAYLGWLYPIGSDKNNDEWIYLPELGMTRRIVPRDQTSRANDEDEFAGSLLTHEHLEPRPPHLDHHHLLSTQEYNGRPHYLIESKPMHHGHGGHHGHHGGGDSASKRVSWIDQERMQINRIEFFDGQGKVQLDMQIEWFEQAGYWLWKGVVAENPETKARTVLKVTESKVNSGLKERLFHKRNLDKGSARFR